MKYVLIVLIILGTGYTLPVQAEPNLLITPLRLEIEPRMRSAALTLVNNGDKTGTYRISIVNKRMDKNGILKEVPADSATEAGELFANSMIRISPRQVTIPPQGSQTVRLMVRRPPGLAAGEYRSHLVFTLDPLLDEPATEAAPATSIQIHIKAEVGISIPLIVRQGELPPAHGAITEAKRTASSLKITLTRTGQRSLYGDITVKHQAADGTETLLATMGGIAVYVPNTLRHLTIPLTIPPSLKQAGGSLVVTYAAKKDQGGEVIATKVVAMR